MTLLSRSVEQIKSENLHYWEGSLASGPYALRGHFPRGPGRGFHGYGSGDLVGAVCETDQIGYDDREQESVGEMDNNCNA